MVIDPAVIKPAIESYNRIVRATHHHVTYHLPALHGLTAMVRTMVLGPELQRCQRKLALKKEHGQEMPANT